MQSKKTIPIILLLLTFATSIVAYPLCAGASTPSVPTFTVQYVDHSYDVPPTYGRDAYTGETIVINGGYHVTQHSVDVTIQNQAFTPYKDENNITVSLFYNVRAKGHFEDWSGDGGSHGVSAVQADASGSTVVSFDIQYWGVKSGGQIDFQVQAVAGYPASDSSYCGSVHFNTIATSAWSSTQTLTIGTPIAVSPTPYTSWTTPTPIPYYQPDPTSNPTENPTATPIQPDTQSGILFAGVDWETTGLIVLAIVVVTAVVAVIIIVRRVSIK